MSARRQRPSDLVSILEVAYAPANTSDEWLRNLLDALSTFYLGGEGCFGHFFERTGSRSFRYGSHAFTRLPQTYGDRLQSSFVGPEVPEYVEAAYNCPPVTTLSRVMPVVGGRARLRNRTNEAALNEAMVRENVKDMLGLRAEDGSGHGVLLAAPLSRITRLERREVATLMRILCHVSAGYRLLDARRGTDDTDAEAVLRPDGRVDHAVGIATEQSARRSLAFGAARVERARGRLRRVDPESAVEAWRALVAGRWSLVDHVDSDGKRYLFARRNEVRPRISSDRLAGREREVAALAALGHSNKLIAYELGLETATVSNYLAAACRKLRATSRVELIRAMSAAEKRP